MDGVKGIIASNLRKYCKYKGVKNKDIAELLGVSTGSVANWMNGTNGIDIENLYKICIYLGIDLNVISGYTPTTIVLNGEVQHLVSVFEALDDLGRSKLTEYADDLAASGRYVRTATEKDA